MKSENVDVKHFQAIPWCRALLEEPNIVRETASSRYLKPSGEDILFATVLNTPDTIKAFLALYRLPPPSPPGSPATRIDEARFLITLGYNVAGYPHVCHGGIVMTILDEVIGLLLPLNKERNAIPETSYMTGYLNTSFLKPVSVPGTYLCRSTIDKVEGRKYWMTGTIEDSTGAVVARGEALYIGLKEKL
ncbi:HotDog domain-containing protein [Plectosphaerella plurivora]|uniref:HotDog domain-containing protein n=1 Tax=Plectosphaerella plurivora TaxID=936078 RepID=A0A9P8VJM7_9PEZI|nr:HotDog domain-containing protein [Plectosphaerella plurivora]